MGLEYDMSDVFSASEWLMDMLQVSSQDEIIIVSTTLYRIWLWKNRKVRENKVTTGVVVMENNFMYVKEWRDVRSTKNNNTELQLERVGHKSRKWTPVWRERSR